MIWCIQNISMLPTPLWCEDCTQIIMASETQSRYWLASPFTTVPHFWCLTTCDKTLAHQCGKAYGVLWLNHQWTQGPRGACSLGLVNTEPRTTHGDHWKPTDKNFPNSNLQLLGFQENSATTLPPETTPTKIWLLGTCFATHLMDEEIVLHAIYHFLPAAENPFCANATLTKSKLSEADLIRTKLPLQYADFANVFS